jgi:hypothetical protein
MPKGNPAGYKKQNKKKMPDEKAIGRGLKKMAVQSKKRNKK